MDDNISKLAAKLMEKGYSRSMNDAMKEASKMLGPQKQVKSMEPMDQAPSPPKSIRPEANPRYLDENKRLFREKALKPKPFVVQTYYDTPNKQK
jgi:hypothetical protein